MSSVITTANVSGQLYKQKMNELRAFLKVKKCPVGLRKRVRTYYEHLYQNKTVFDEQSMMEVLPPVMKFELVGFMYGEIIEKSMLFRDLDEEVITRPPRAC